MGVIEGLLSSLPAEPVPVRIVAVGVRWTAVASVGCGLAATCLPAEDGAARTLPEAGKYHLKSVQDLVQGLNSDNPLEASIGLAAYSSSLYPLSARSIEMNAFDLVAQLGAGKRVVMVGHFPQADWLQERVGSLKILEKRPRPGDYPAEAAPDLIPAADVVAITAMTILNRTIDGLLALCPPNARVVVLGPSAPLSPVLFDYGVDFISGSAVTDEAKVLLAVMQDGSIRSTQGTKKLILFRDYAESGLHGTFSPLERI